MLNSLVDLGTFALTALLTPPVREYDNILRHLRLGRAQPGAHRIAVIPNNRVSATLVIIQRDLDV